MVEMTQRIRGGTYHARCSHHETRRIDARRVPRLRPLAQELENRRQLSTFIVTNFTDATVADELSLRQAINLASTAATSSTIEFDPTVFATPRTIILTQGQLELSGTMGAVTITGPAAGVTVSGGGNSRVLKIDSGVTALISGLTISGGHLAGQSLWGAGIDNGGNTRLSDCTISGNSAHYYGGVYNNGTLNMTGCTISGNSAADAGGLCNTGSADLTDCTISGNSATSTGGGLTNYQILKLTDCTISSNSAGSQGGGGIFNLYPSTLVMQDTIVAGNTASGPGPDVDGLVTSHGNNLIGAGDGATDPNGGTRWVGSDLIGTIASPIDPKLGPLGNYGGPTDTMPLLPTSPAIGGGVAISGVTMDQRGVPRGLVVDIGAVQQAIPSLTVSASTVSAISGQPVHVTASITTFSFAAPTGVITFLDGGSIIGTASVDNSGNATIGITSLPLGSHSITATYSGDSRIVGVTSSNTVYVSVSPAVTVDPQAPTVPPDPRGVPTAAPVSSRVALAPVWVYDKYGKPVAVELKARVWTQTPAAGMPTGVVVFELLRSHRNPRMLGSAPLKSGKAMIFEKPNVVNKRSIEVLYSGNANFSPSVDAKVIIL